MLQFLQFIVIRVSHLGIYIHIFILVYSLRKTSNTHQHSISNLKVLLSTFLHRSTVRHVGSWLIAGFYGAVEHAFSEWHDHTLTRCTTLQLCVLLLLIAPVSNGLSCELGRPGENALQRLALEVSHSIDGAIIFSNQVIQHHSSPLSWGKLGLSKIGDDSWFDSVHPDTFTNHKVPGYLITHLRGFGAGLVWGVAAGGGSRLLIGATCG